MPETANAMPSRSGQRLRQTAETTPIVMPNTTDQDIAATVSQNVGMNRSPISTLTGRLVRSDRPKSPCTTPDTKRRNCCGSGLSSPRSLANQGDRFRRRVRAGGKTRRIAGQQMDEQERQRTDQQQGRDQPEKALDDVLEHRVAARGPGLRRARGW